MCGRNKREQILMIETYLKSLALAGYRSYDQDLSENKVELKDINIPYIQLHEFEALLFTEIKVLKCDFLEHEDMGKIDRLYEDTKGIPPEEINHGDETASSKQLLHTVSYQKGEVVSEWLAMIGIDQIRKKCPHFSEWIA